jgi:hypothetical protein
VSIQLGYYPPDLVIARAHDLSSPVSPSPGGS